MQKSNEWLDFNAIKASADVLVVLDQVGVLDELKQRGDEVSGWCPLGTKRHGKKDSFSVNVESKTFQCFACKKRGSILDFVAQCRDVSVRDAAAMVRDIMAGADKLDDRADKKRSFENSDARDTRHQLRRSFENDDDGRNPYGHIDDEPKPDNDAFLQAVMTLRQAVDRVKAGTLKADDVVVIDVSTLRYLYHVVKGCTR